ncbi:DUF3131 domain-containing protein [Sulfitobacter sp. 916]|uniref:DUF3131 domain-containing protein n=1 Tax=Sulfitobacter sp. 916 TaxID=3368559 RepID=UPI003744D828
MIGRRTFLKWGTAAPVFLSQQIAAHAASATAQNTLIVIDGIDCSTAPDRLAIVLDTFVREGLPVTCLIDLGRVNQSAAEPDGAFSKMLRERLENNRGLIQAVPIVRRLGEMTPYFQARAAHEALQALQHALWGDAEGRLQVLSGQTIACDMREQAVAPSGVRASGIRNILMRPHVSTRVRPEAWEDGVLRVVGGQRVALQSAQTPSIFQARQPVERVLYVSAQDFLSFPLARLGPTAARFATQVLQQAGDDWVSPILAADLQFRDAYAYKRQMALHFVLEPDATPQDRAALTAFRLELNDVGLPSSFGSETVSDPEGGYWITLNEADPSMELETFKRVEEETRGVPSAVRRTAYGLAAALHERAKVGLNAHNILNLPTIHIRDGRTISQALESSLGTGDVVLVVSAKLLRVRAYRNTLSTALQAVAYDGITSIVSLPDYVRRLVPRGPYITHFRRTEVYRQPPKKLPHVLQDKERAQLMADAKVAWSYFERWTNPKTGLCPATVNSAAGQRRLHEAVTMWDVGSHIFALMAAVDLELISSKQFQGAIRRILPNIAGRPSQGRLLPQGWIATDKFKWGTKDFDGCDAGRLLAALYNLDMHPLAKDKSAPTVAAWDLEAVVKEGIIYSVENGVLASTFRSHCAHYAAWAFRTWGIDVLSPYEVFQGQSRSDGQMALLEVAGRIGPLGAEPLLMEAMEFGMSTESAYLAEVLFAAQLEEYDETGRLICVSEGPINSPPWFLYQGLQFDAQGRIWATDTVAGLNAHRTKAFREQYLSISSKGAYLWSAYKNHPFCDKLRRLVRDKAKTPYGFASSINQKTGQASQNYSDINTNAVILQSIAQLMKAEA